MIEFAPTPGKAYCVVLLLLRIKHHGQRPIELKAGLVGGGEPPCGVKSSSTRGRHSDVCSQCSVEGFLD